MKNTRKNTLAALLLGSILSLTTTQAATTAVTVAAGTKITNTSDWAAGWEFTVTDTISVTHLGKFDYENNGIVGTAVGLYDRTAGGIQLATVSLIGATADTSGTYDTYFAELSTAVVLTPGNTYTIVAVQDGPTEAIFWAANTATYASGINYVRGIASSGASLPATFTSNTPQLTGTTNGYFGGTFMFEPGVIPEPSTALLSGIGLLALLRRRR